MTCLICHWMTLPGFTRPSGTHADYGCDYDVRALLAMTPKLPSSAEVEQRLVCKACGQDFPANGGHECPKVEMSDADWDHGGEIRSCCPNPSLCRGHDENTGPGNCPDCIQVDAYKLRPCGTIRCDRLGMWHSGPCTISNLRLVSPQPDQLVINP